MRFKNFLVFATIILAFSYLHRAYADFDPLVFSHQDYISPIVSLQDSSSSDCLTITEYTVLNTDVPCIYVADNVVVDLNGFTVNGFIVQLDSGSGVTIKNGAISGADAAVILLGRDILLERLTVQDSEQDFTIQIGGGLITHSRFLRNSIAIDLFWGAGIKVRHSYFSENRIAVIIGSDNDSLIQKNVFVDNGRGVFIWDEDFFGSSGSIIYRNFFKGNDIGVFLLARNESDDTNIEKNMFFANNASGIVLGLGCFLQDSDECAGRRTMVKKNLLINNGADALTLTGSWPLPETSEPYEIMPDDGITVFAPLSVGSADGATLRKNVAIRNFDLGIEASGVIDGGENRASANGNPLQCEGVSC